MIANYVMQIVFALIIFRIGMIVEMLIEGRYDGDL